MEAPAQPWVLRALGPERRSLCFLDGFKISCPYPYFIRYGWKRSMLFIWSLSSQGKLQDGSQEEANYGLQLINGHLTGLQRLRRWRISQGCSFTSRINIAAWSLTSVFRLFMQVLQEKSSPCLWDGGARGHSWGEEEDKKLQAESGKTWFISLLGNFGGRIRSMALLWKCAFPKSSALLMALLQESRRWACTLCKRQV